MTDDYPVDEINVDDVTDKKYVENYDDEPDTDTVNDHIGRRRSSRKKKFGLQCECKAKVFNQNLRNPQTTTPNVKKTSTVRDESKFEISTLSVNPTLRGWGGQVLDAKD